MLPAATPNSKPARKAERKSRVLQVFVLLVITILTAPTFHPTSISFASSQSFTDVPETHWASPFIAPLSESGIIGGYPDGSFKPQGEVKINELIAMAVKALGYRFESLSSDWSKPYVDKAIELKIIQDREFPSYTALISREQMTSIVVKAIALNEMMPNATMEPYIKNEMKDYHLVGDYYKQSVLDSYKLGIITGFDDQSFKPKGFSTRAQASAVISKIMTKNLRTPFVKTNARYTMILTSELDEFGNEKYYEIALYAPLLNGKPVNEMIDVAELMVKNISHGKGYINVSYNQEVKVVGSAGYESKEIKDWHFSLSPYEMIQNIEATELSISIDFNNFNDRYKPYYFTVFKRPLMLEKYPNYSTYYLAVYGEQLMPIFKYWFEGEFDYAWSLFVKGLDATGSAKQNIYTLNGRTFSLVTGSNTCSFAIGLKK